MNKSEIEELYKEFHTPHHVRAHCLKVAMVGEFIAKELNKVGVDVDAQQAWAAGMIHDFVRVVDFSELPEDLGTKEDQLVWGKLRGEYKGRHHADVGAEILKEKGFKALGDTVSRHQTAFIGTEKGPTDWPSMLLYYADKRVSHDKIVSLTDRLDEAWERHFNNRNKTEDEETVMLAIYALEKEIFKPLNITPDDVTKALT
jgi:putative nucleotidyltransferase with HDIG domain